MFTCNPRDHGVGSTLSVRTGTSRLARDLLAGETIGTYDGFATVVAVIPRAARATVYNLEVCGSHTYFVSDAKAWVHNQCMLTAEAEALVKLAQQGGRLDQQTLFGFRQGNRMILGSSHWDVMASNPGTNFSSWEHGYASLVDGQWVFRSSY